MLARKQSDGSFKFWSKSSVWLTAYMVKLMNYAKRSIPSAATPINEAKKFIRQMQNPDGSFNDPTNFSPGSSEAQKGIPLAAYIAIAFMESGEDNDKDEPFVKKALKYITDKAFSLKDNYALAISSYALALQKHPQAINFTTSLISAAIETADEMMYWNRVSKSYNPNESASIQVEIAAYAAMALITQGRSQETLPIFKWLMTQRNQFGGFRSTQDSVIGIQALAMVADHFTSSKGTIDFKMSYERERRRNFVLDSTNDKTLQQKAFESDARNVSLVANGTGIAYFQLSYNYYLKLENSTSGFSITARHAALTATPMILEVCVRFVPIDGINESGMTLIEIQLPSGYVYDSRTDASVKSVGVKVSKMTSIQS